MRLRPANQRRGGCESRRSIGGWGWGFQPHEIPGKRPQFTPARPGRRYPEAVRPAAVVPLGATILLGTAVLVGTAVLLASATAAAQARAIARAPSARAARLIQSGDAFLRAGDRGSAIAYYRDAVAADPQATGGYERLGEAYRARGSLDDARAVYETALSRHPEHTPLWLGLARTLVDSDRLDDAAAAVRSLLARTPDDPDGLAMRAELAFRRGAWSEALTAYRTLIAASARIGLDPARVDEARRYEAALRVLARPLDPVSAPRACDETPLRRALAHCR